MAIYLRQNHIEPERAYSFLAAKIGLDYLGILQLGARACETKFYCYWQHKWVDDPSVIGKTIDLMTSAYSHSKRVWVAVIEEGRK